MVYRRKNLQLHRLPAPWAVAPDQLEKWLEPQAFQPGNTLEKQSFGWASPCDDGALVYSINRQMLLMLRAEKKLLPASVINQMTKTQALELEKGAPPCGTSATRWKQMTCGDTLKPANNACASR